MFPVDWCIQIVFLIFQKIKFLDAGCFQRHFSSQNLEMVVAEQDKAPKVAHDGPSSARRARLQLWC